MIACVAGEIIDLKQGNKAIKKVCQGETELWPLTGTRYYKELAYTWVDGSLTLSIRETNETTTNNYFDWNKRNRVLDIYEFNGTVQCPTCAGVGSVTVTCPTCNGSGNVEELVTCSACGGTGYVDGNVCSSCGGSGMVMESVTCPTCDGNGTITETCETCDGTGRIPDDETTE